MERVDGDVVFRREWTQFGGTGRLSCPMSHVIADRGAVPLTIPELSIQVEPLIQPQTVMPLIDAVFRNTEK